MLILAEKQPDSVFYIRKDPDVDIMKANIQPSGLTEYDVAVGCYDPHIVYGFEFEETELSKDKALEVFKEKIIQQWSYDCGVYAADVSSVIEKAKQWKLTEYERSSD